MSDKRGDAPSAADIAFEDLWIWWAENYGIEPVSARWLALYQYTGGNAFALLDLDGKINYAPKPVA